MTRVHTNARPMDYTRGLQPITPEDEAFWRRRRGEPVKPGILQRLRQALGGDNG